MIAGKTNIDCGTKIKTTLRWDRTIITGIITHPFGCFGKYDYGDNRHHNQNCSENPIFFTFHDFPF